MKTTGINNTSLMQRLLTLVLLPMFLTQLLSIYIVYHRHLERTLREDIRISVKNIESANKYFNEQKKKQNFQPENIISKLNSLSQFDVKYTVNTVISEKDVIKKKKERNKLYSEPKVELNNVILNTFDEKTGLYKDKSGNFVLEIQKNNDVLSFIIDKKIFSNHNLYLIILWNFVSFLFVGGIAIIFVKNQIRSINQLKDFANDFSYLEKDDTYYKPAGAKEIREMGVAFLNMVKKWKFFLNSRTMMLAQISHDLRTPLTRMKLETEFLEDKESRETFKKDLNEMEKIINEYILFAKGETNNDYLDINIKSFFNNILDDYSRSNYKNIKLNFNLKTEICSVKYDSFKRAINNIVNNALKYRKKYILITIITNNNNLIIRIEDDGKGVSEEQIAVIQRPFISLNSKDAKNINTQSNGLGLSIVKQIVLSHKGKISFGKSKSLGGFLVNISLPLHNKQKKEENEDI